jgi:signal transduction histidine kinase
MTEYRRQVTAPRTALAGHLALSALLAFTMVVLWAFAGRGVDGYFWPMWVWLGLGIPLGLHVAIRRAWVAPRGRHRQLAVQAAISIVIGSSQLLIWAMSGAGFFWPIFPILGLGLVYALHLMFRPPGDPGLAMRVDELTRTRRGALDVQAAELRRIERDLHDGAQSRLVALSLQLGRAEERLAGQPELEALVRQARTEATAAITELRDLARGIAPPVLADRGLAAAVRGLGNRSGASVTVSAEIEQRPVPVIETAAYFVAAESLTNAVKHAPGAHVRIVLLQAEHILLIEVADDGPGGADPLGSGLTGLRQRVEALDGTIRIDSPAGGGTTIEARIPCG